MKPNYSRGIAYLWIVAQLFGSSACMVGGGASVSFSKLRANPTPEEGGAGAVPTVAITSPAQGVLINSANVASFGISGTCSESGRPVTISGAVIAAANCESGNWGVHVNLSAASEGAIKLYVDHTNAAGIPATQSSRSFFKDTEAPSANTISINAGASATNNAAVTLTFTSAGATEQYITNSAGCTEGGNWEAFAGSVPWNLPSANADNTVYVKFRDSALNETACFQRTITHDSLPPNLSIGAPSTTSVGEGGTVTYTVTYTGASAVTLAGTDISLNQTGDATCTISVSGAGVTTRTVTLDGCSGNGTLGITIASDTATDAAGNSALGIGPSGTFSVSDIDFAVTHPTHLYNAYTSLDTSAYVTSFTNPDGATVTCSWDGGGNYGACNSATTIVFTPAHFNGGAELRIKFVLGGTTEIYSFVPQSMFAGKSFYECDTVISAATAATLNFPDFVTNHLSVANRKICIEAGAVISDATAAAMSFGASNITVIGALTGVLPKFRNTSHSGVFTIPNTVDDIRLINLQIENGATTAGSSDIIRSMNGGVGGNPKDIEIRNVTITGYAGNSGYGIYLWGGEQLVTIADATIMQTLNNHAIRMESSALNVVNVTNSFMLVPSLSHTVLNASGGTLNISKSVLRGGTSGGVVGVWGGSGDATVNLTQVMLEARDRGLTFNCNNSSYSCFVNMDRVVMKHLNAGVNGAAIDLLNAPYAFVNSVGSKNNVACNESSAGTRFTQIIANGPNAGDYTPSNPPEQNLNNTSINDCTSYDMVAP